MSDSISGNIQHYVPKFILRKFCIPGTSKVFVFDKKKDKIFKTNIKNIAGEKDFYNHDIGNIKISAENNLGNIESFASKVIQKIIDNESLIGISEEEKIQLSIFLATQFLRVKQSRITEMQMITKLHAWIEKMGLDSSNVEGLDQYDSEKSKINSILGLGDDILKFAPYFYDKSWLLCKAPSNYPYYISDNPINLHNNIDFWPRGNLGLAVEGIEIYFPLSKDVSISLICKSYEEKFTDFLKKKNLMKFLKIDEQNEIKNVEKLLNSFTTGVVNQNDEQNVIFKNSLQVMSSSRFIFSSIDNFELAREMINENPDFRNPPQIKMG